MALFKDLIKDSISMVFLFCLELDYVEYNLSSKFYVFGFGMMMVMVKGWIEDWCW